MDSEHETTPPPIPPRIPKSNAGESRSIQVTGFDKSVSEEALRLHFENHKKSRGGPVESVTVTNELAKVCFKDVGAAERVLGAQQKLRDQILKVTPLSDVSRPSSFIVSGMNPTTTSEMLVDFLESKTDYTVKGHFILSDGYVSVTFSDESKPELTKLQNVLKSARLEGRHLNIALSTDDDDDHDYIEPVEPLEINTTGEKLKYIQNFKMAELEKELNKVNVTVTLDLDQYMVILKGKKEDLKKGKDCWNTFIDRFVINEHTINMPGIKFFFQTEEALVKISLIEAEEKVAVFCLGDIYETIQFLQEDVFCDDSDSNPSGGSVQFTDIKAKRNSLPETEQVLEGAKPTEGDYKMLQSSETMATFQIGKCQFQLKEGLVEKEEVDCIVNITQLGIEQGDMWTVLSDSCKQELQLDESTVFSELSKKGFILSTCTGLPFKSVAHVSLKHCGGDMHKVIKKTLQSIKSKGVTSLAIYTIIRPGKKDELYPRFIRDFVDEINKYQKKNPEIKDFRLLVDKMADSYVTGVRQEVDNLEARSKKQGFKINFRSILPSRLRILSSPEKDTKLPPPPPLPQQPVEPTPVPDNDTEEAFSPPEGADVVICICSENEDSITRTINKLEEYCRKQMPPKVIDDPKIRKLTDSQIKLFRKRAGRKVEVELNPNTGHAEIRGFKKDIDSVYAKLKVELDKIQESPPDSNGDSSEESETSEDIGSTTATNHTDVAALPSVPVQREIAQTELRRPESSSSIERDDEWNIFGMYIANELRAITDEEKRKKVKRQIQMILLDAES